MRRVRLVEFALGAVGAVERERRRLIVFRVIAPVSAPPSPLRIADSVALLARDESHALMIPAAGVHLFHGRSVTRLRRGVAGLCARPRLAAGFASNERYSGDDGHGRDPPARGARAAPAAQI